MSLAGAAIAAYRRSVDLVGEPVTLVKGAQSVTVKARVVGFAPAELVGSIQQGDRKVIMPAEPFANGALPVPVEGVNIVVGGKTLRIEAVDDRTRRVAGVLIAYELAARG